MRLFLCILATISATSLSACGQTGPLYLPERPKLPESSVLDAGSRAQPANQAEPSRQP